MKVGRILTSYFSAVSLSSSASILTKITVSACESASARVSKMGAMCLQGAHQVAKTMTLTRRHGEKLV